MHTVGPSSVERELDGQHVSNARIEALYRVGQISAATRDLLLGRMSQDSSTSSNSTIALQQAASHNAMAARIRHQQINNASGTFLLSHVPLDAKIFCSPRLPTIIS